ncbi:histidine phosphatase family protein [Variovorax sp. KK3]|uniref:histidine phosphatase family protein n=1 Tax=Variovorax sp. KK3 TaxID=1855728 RepID=UPI00097C2070|nr:histidine phosphatase family protein [Variovorax sp. KK3]
MKLNLVRHAQTTAATGACYGRSDVDVTPEATQAIAERIAPALPAGIALVCSPLRRCAGLADAIVALRPELSLRVDPRIAEMDFGDWEGHAWSAIARAEFDAWTRDFADARAGGTGESTRAFMQRVGEAYDEWQAAGHDALWVTHAGVIRAVWALREGMRCVERADQWPSRPIGFGEWVVVEG